MNTFICRIGAFAVLAWTVNQGAIVLAITTDWSTNSNGNFNTAANWNNGVPTSIDMASFRRGSAFDYTVSLNGGLPGSPQQHTVFQLMIGSNTVTFVRNGFVGVATFVADDNTAGDRGIVVGDISGDNATFNTSIPISGTAAAIANSNSTGTWNVNASSLTLSGPGSANINDVDHFPLVVGNLGNGSLNVAAGASVNMTGDAALAYSAGSSGMVSLNGTGANLTAGGVDVGESGSATLNITNGGTVTTGNDANHIALQASSIGTVTVDGAGSKWISQSSVDVGVNGTGRMDITGGGQVSDAEGQVGLDTGSFGEVTVDGPGSSWVNGGGVGIGFEAPGVVSVSGGGNVSCNDVDILDGAVIVNGNDSRWTIATDLALGTEPGLSTLTITDGGQVSNRESTISAQADAMGIVTVDGVGSTWTNNGEIDIGSRSQGILNVTGGGHLVGMTNAFVGSESASSGTVTIDGLGSLWSQIGNLTVGAGGIGSSVVVRNGGIVSVGGTLTIGAAGAVKGNGTITGNVSNGGLVAPGSSIGSLHITGNYMQTAAGKLQIELDGTSTGSQYDQLLVTGADSLAGILQVSLTSSFAPAAGNSFNILDWGTLSGTFAMVNLPGLAGGLSWNTSQLYSTGTISVVGPALAGDYNGNGVVDAADYTVWRDTLGMTGSGLAADGDGSGTIDQADYNIWKSNFGTHAGSGSGASVNAAVPEPSTLLMLLAGIPTMCSRRRAMAP
jgi:T5SS/PEP-CTERM-associated repeat protein